MYFIYFLLSSLFSLVSFAVSLKPLSAELEQEAKNIVNKLQEKKLITNMISYQAGIPPHGQSTKMIILIKEPDRNIVAKVFIIEEDYKDEKKQIKKINKIIGLVEEENRKAKLDIPHFVKIYGYMRWPDSGVILMSQAQGESLASIIANFSSYSKDDIERYFGALGFQQGNLDALFFKNRKSLILHPDLHAENLIFDEKNLKSTWIDLAGISEKRSENLTGNANYLSAIKNTVFFSPGSNSAYTYLINKTDDFKIIELYLSQIEKGIIAYGSFSRGYLKALADNKLPNEFKNREAYFKEQLEQPLKLIRHEILQKYTNELIRNSLAKICRLCLYNF